MPHAGGDPQSGTDWLLPEIMREVAEVIGRRQAFILAGAVCPPATPETRGIVRGRSGFIYIPCALRKGRTERLIEIVGRDDAQRLVEAFGGMILRFPPCELYLRSLRDRGILAMVAEGWPRWIVAWSFDVCERTVCNVTRRSEGGRPAGGRRAEDQATAA